MSVSFYEFLFRFLQVEEANQVDPYVRLSLFDANSGGTEAFRTSTQMNDGAAAFFVVRQPVP